MKVITAITVAVFLFSCMAAYGGGMLDPCYSCQVAGLDGECTAIAPDAGFGYKECSIKLIPREITVCTELTIPPCNTYTVYDRECKTKYPCLLAPPF